VLRDEGRDPGRAAVELVACEGRDGKCVTVWPPRSRQVVETVRGQGAKYFFLIFIIFVFLIYIFYQIYY
jgi:hypothetical protein